MLVKDVFFLKIIFFYLNGSKRCFFFFKQFSFISMVGELFKDGVVKIFNFFFFTNRRNIRKVVFIFFKMLHFIVFNFFKMLHFTFEF